MDSPVRKMQKQKDYQRHKLFRKMKRQRKARIEQEQKIAEKELKRKLRRPKFDKGDDNPYSYVGNLSELWNQYNPETGGFGSGDWPVAMDEVVVTAPKKQFSWNKYYDPIWNNANSKYSTYDKASVENLVKLIDPTGISSWADAINAGKNFISDTNVANGVDFMLSALGAMPMIGKFSKPIRAMSPIFRAPGNFHKFLFKGLGSKINNYLDGWRKIMPYGVPTAQGINNGLAATGRFYNTDIPLETSLRYSAGSPGLRSALGFLKPYENSYNGSYNYFGKKKQGTYSGSNMGDLDILGLYLNGDIQNLNQSKTPREIIVNNHKFPDKQYDVKIFPTDTLHLDGLTKEMIDKAIVDNKVLQGSTDMIPKGESWGKYKTLVDAGRFTIKPKKVGDKYYIDAVDEWGLEGNGGILGKLADNKAIRNGGGPVTLKQDNIRLLFDDNRDDEWFRGMMQGPNEKYWNYGYDSGKDIHIKPSKRGTFTAAAKKHGMGVQAYARKVLKAPKGKYSAAMRRKANFARNASKWAH